MWRVKKALRGAFHMREPHGTTRATPNRCPVGSWRWLLLDRFEPVRWSGQMKDDHSGWEEPKPTDERQPGDIVHYSLVSFSRALMRKFPKAWRWQYRHTHRKFRGCDCNHRIWSWRGAAIMPSCERHGFPKMFPDLWPELEKRRAARDSESAQ